MIIDCAPLGGRCFGVFIDGKQFGIVQHFEDCSYLEVDSIGYELPKFSFLKSSDNFLKNLRASFSRELAEYL